MVKNFWGDKFKFYGTALNKGEMQLIKQINLPNLDLIGSINVPKNNIYKILTFSDIFC